MSSDGVEQTPPDLLDEGPSNNNDDDDAMFSSAMSPATLDIPLGGNEDEENDDDNPFGGPLTTQPIREKTPTNTTNVIEVTPPAQSAPSTDEMDEDPFGTTTKPAVSEPVAYPVLAKAVETPPRSPASEPVAYPVLAKPVETPPPPASIQTQLSTPSTPPVVPKTLSEPPKTKPVETKQTRVERKIEVTVSDPSKVGEGMSSYMTYRISTRTTLPIFKKQEFSVNRRFSDFLGLHGKLIQKYLHQGLLLPHPPEKDSLSMAKVKISKDEGIPTDFIDRRRALLERYLNRLVQQEKVLEDSDVREFLENPSDLPKATNTQALSGAGFLRAFSTISSQVTKLTTKTSEQDQWFEEKYAFVIELQNHFKRLYEQMNSLFNYRRESAQALKQFSASLNHLAHVEEHALLSSVLVELANLEEKLDQLTNEYALKEYSTLSELAKEYVGLLEMVQLSFNERIKAHQQWLNAEDTLKKKRETKAKLEQSPKNADKLPQAEKEIHDWEGKVVSGKEDFERISTTIRHELDVFEETRIDDFKNAIDHYLKNLLEEQERALQLWESFLPEASKIAV